MTKITTGKVRFSYANVFEPKAMAEGQDAKYSVSLIIPKSDTKTINDIKKSVKEALETGKSKVFGGKIPTIYKNPLRDGDEERPEDEAYADSYFINANSDRQPIVVGKNRQEIIDTEEFYSGCYGKASVTFYAFNKAGNKGVAVGLNALLKLSEGEPLGAGKVNIEEEFKDDFEDDDDFMS